MPALALRVPTGGRRAPGTEMTPELRAIADRFIYEQATLKHITALAGDEGLSRTVPGMDWTVRQLLGHLGASLGSYDVVIRRWTAGEPALEGWDPDAVNAETAARMASASQAELLAEFGRGLVGLIAAMEDVPDQKMDEQLGRTDALTALKSLANHTLRHAIPLVDALPEIRMDPLVLNWLLSATFDDAESEQWQERLLDEARAYIASQPDEEYEDEDE